MKRPSNLKIKLFTIFSRVEKLFLLTSRDWKSLWMWNFLLFSQLIFFLYLKFFDDIFLKIIFLILNYNFLKLILKLLIKGQKILIKNCLIVRWKKNSSAFKSLPKKCIPLLVMWAKRKKFYAVKRCSQGKIVNLFTAMIAHSFTIYYERTMQQVCKKKLSNNFVTLKFVMMTNKFIKKVTVLLTMNNS